MAPTVPYYKVSNPRSTKHHLKYLADLKNPKVIGHNLSKSPDTVIKAICNAAVNALRGQVPLTKKQCRFFAKNRGLIEALVSKSKSIKTKRASLVQSGGSILLATLLPLVLGTLGSLFFSKK